jgi:hypothetical protein
MHSMTPSDFEKRSRAIRELRETCPHRVFVDQAFSIGTSFRLRDREGETRAVP